MLDTKDHVRILLISDCHKHSKMTTKYFCISNFRRLTMRRTVSALGVFCAICLLLHMWFADERKNPSQEINSSLDLSQLTKATPSYINASALTKVPDQNTYILSAIIPFDRLCSTYPAVIVNVFGTSDVTLYCCIIQDGHKLHISPASLLRQFHRFMFLSAVFEFFNPAPFPARQITCPLVSPPGSATFISLTSGTCSSHSDQYKPIVHVTDHTGDLAVCAKIAYNDALKPARLVEWMEFQKLMGVDKVVIFTLDIPDDVRDVFEFYVSQGLLVTVPYQLAGDLKRSMRFGNRSYPQFFHDEQLAVFDCRERLSGYGHVAGIDLDEIIIPRSGQTLKGLLQNSFSRQYPDAGAYYFYQQFHITDWGPSHPDNSLTTMRYLRTDPPRWESQKFVYVPGRTQFSRTHEVFVKSRFTTYTIPPEVAVIHHYRSCPVTWKDCHTRKRILDNSTLQYQKQLDLRVRTVMSDLNKKS